MDSIVQPADYTHTQLLCSTIVFHHGKLANSAIPKIEVFANRRHFVEKLVEKGGIAAAFAIGFIDKIGLTRFIELYRHIGVGLSPICSKRGFSDSEGRK